MVNFYKPKAVNKNLNQQLTVEINSLDMNGDGVARQGKKPIFVESALPGETVEIKVTEEKSKYLRAKTKKVLVVATNRVTPICKHFYQCGGCDLQHLDYEGQLAFKQQKISDLFHRNSNIEHLPWQPALHADIWHYRRKARIGVQYNKLNEATVGFRQKSSNVLTPIKRCPVLPETFADEFSDFVALINSFSSKQAISHIEVIKAEVSVVIFRQVRKLSNNDKQKLHNFNLHKPYQVALQQDDGLHFLEPQNDNYLSYKVSGCELQFTTTDFVQVNINLNAKMVNQAIQWLELDANDNVLDLFCGLGNFSLPIAKRVNAIVGVEGVQDMVDRAAMNAQSNQLSNCQFYQADLNAENNDWPWLNANNENIINKVVLDPARAGAYNAVKNIVELNVKTVLYVSCDAATMARDTKILLDNGFTLSKICLMDMFSQTRHVETMALFVRP
ncbi:23S rRNA (uracil(1939)-C(5))-methyltransferase RlmD [Thalassotalea psychrophila]|uniref:23S rRNA (uracil(1939)-C(5))-methyltransferase RlmD n=1 Tax=Thalassotalea psychrophila TaxID=3065647 RepID=A0ABY9TSQ4_9GAMM|nr:23S rRNA (uracil(1939)-C(5))-methyltransferase RlmD [Colwelliaceae bacterium SQ149]